MTISLDSLLQCLEWLPVAFFIVVAGIVAVSPAANAKPAKYAILSLAGDQLTAVMHSQVTGFSLHQNQKEDIPIPDQSNDKLILKSAERAFVQALPQAQHELLIAQ